MKEPPELDRVKDDLRDILGSGVQTKIAGMQGISSQAVSQRYSRGSNTKPSTYEFLREAWMVCSADEDSGWKFKAYVISWFDRWLTPIKATEKTVTALIREGHESYGNVITARLEGRPLNELREELRGVRKAIDQLESALDNEFELRSESEVSRFQRKAQ